ncbi:hypothetical protein RIR_jg40451.t1 [Rhizophagus irregularis DAOM 181602=DAOM 197198]|nr:hypothetical protein RIR_jg40451.t1 [Rhizophagus irregularis DAOM 181602=DAOM 197198]
MSDILELLITLRKEDFEEHYKPFVYYLLSLCYKEGFEEHYQPFIYYLLSLCRLQTFTTVRFDLDFIKIQV